MYKVGITGGIGSGKSVACRIFEASGVPVYDADARAKQLMNDDGELKAALTEYFGNDIYENGVLNRRKLSEIIFTDKDAIEKVNSLVHPAVARDFIGWCNRQTAPYVLEESAILFETGTARRFDKIILVTAPEELRIKRVGERDGISTEAVRARMNNQWPDEKKEMSADFVIRNDESHPMIPQVMEIHRKLLSEAKIQSE